MLKTLLRPNESKIVMLVMDGLGGIRTGDFPETALERARTPNMDRLAAAGLCGRSLPISHGITPGSGPAHLALFGYDPLAPENDLRNGRFARDPDGSACRTTPPRGMCPHL
jgi:2,3-bisphosphoglycerate-independent phosphoglycerate mutase